MTNSRDSLGYTAKEIQNTSKHLPNGIFVKSVIWLKKNVSRVHRKYFQRLRQFQTSNAKSIHFKDTKRIEIVIPIFGPSKLLGSCLQSIQDSSGIEAKVILIDNGASAAALDIAEKYVCVVKIIKNDENTGFGNACNQGIEFAEGDFVVLMNSDIIVRVDSIRLLLDQIEMGENIALCSSVLINKYGRVEEAGRVLTPSADAIALFDNAKEKDLPTVGISIVPYASFACLALRRSAYQITNGFDQRFSPAYSEDVDLSIELHKLGFVSIVSYQSRVFHSQGQSSLHLPELDAIKERNRNYLLEKQRPYFKSIGLIDDPWSYPHQLKRALAANMEKRILVICSNDSNIEKFRELAELKDAEVPNSYIGVIQIGHDGEIGSVLGNELILEAQSQGFDLFDSKTQSIQKWFNGRICLFDEVVSLNAKQESINSDLFSLIESTQPQAVFRLLDS